ncbi:MinD/ParA family ATP-binding protein [Microbacterium rhizosphaerae]|uniref:AAA family ATPase n=1 Tax=Microbacterium rhizosphaerae TaxID=1678237 RepID=A0ABZ0SPA5_9MICO|nr:AAA family ATPase [Microbacterium rhizosphaerae]WPR91169.1 AAA family ATPase [Microbacterium rhizosphaerae]
MSPDRIDNTPDADDDEQNGVLSDTASIDTTGIAIFGSTAHVSVSMPVGSEDDDLDSDDVVDDIVADEIAVEHIHLDAAALPALAGSDDASDEAEFQAEDAEVVVAEIMSEDEVFEAVVVEDVDTVEQGEQVEQVEHADELQDAGQEAVAESVDAEPAASEPVESEPVESEPVDAYAAFAAAGFDVSGLTDEPLEPEVLDDAEDGEDVIDVDAPAEEPADLAPVGDAEDLDELDVHLEDEISKTDAVDGDSTQGDELEPADEAPAEDAVQDEGDAVDEQKPTTDSLTRSALRQATGAVPVQPAAAAPGDVERVHQTERVAVHPTEISLTSKRVGEFEPDRESADLLTADRLLDHTKVGRTEPEGTWQQFVYSISGRRINLGDGKRARARKELDRRIAAPLAGGARFVPVVSRKGGVGKTTITTLLGMALADARDDRVIAIDANPDRGTLAERIARTSGRTVRDLARLSGAVNGFNDISTIVARDETRLDIISSDSDPHVSEAFSDHDYRDVAAVAAHYYSIVLTDTGTGIVHSVMGATLDMADELVIVAGLSVDEARLASETLTWLEANGFADKVRRAVVVLNNARPGSPLVLPNELEAHFRSRVRAVVRMPYDPHIGAGTAISYRELQPATREAARQLAATIIEGLRSLDAAA